MDSRVKLNTLHI